MLNKSIAAVSGAMLCAGAAPWAAGQSHRPNILLCVVDDVSYGHWGCYGCGWVKTPGCDLVAEGGVRFTNAYTPNAKSGPSRSCLLTGLTSWQLGEAANHFAFFPADIKTFPESLKEHGYAVGMTGKGWFPGDPGTVDGRPRELAGRKFNSIKCEPPFPTINNTDYAANFVRFLDTRNQDKPFFFWYGGWEAHRPYTYGSGVTADRGPSQVDRVPEIFPDDEIIRRDLCDYALEIEYFDTHLLRMLSELEARGLLDDTLVIVTSDNGMSFPRIKGQCYFDSHHLPLIMMWKGRIRPGSVEDAFVSFTDIAPTIMEAARVPEERNGMHPFEGQSLLPMLAGADAESRKFICVGKERHDVGRPGDAGYPIRAIITDRWMYIRNYEPGRDPAGNPETGYLNYDGSPTKTLLLKKRDRYFRLSFGKRPAEELYDLEEDIDCVHNLAGRRRLKDLKDSLRTMMEEQLLRDGDPRMEGKGYIFDTYLYSNPVNRNYYDRIMQGDSLAVPNWISASDVDYKRQEKIRKKKI